MDSSFRQQLLQGHPAMSDDIGKTVEVQSFNFADYADDDVYASVDQILEPNHSLGVIDEAYCSVLAQSFRHHASDYVLCLLTVYLSAAVNPAVFDVRHCSS